MLKSVKCSESICHDRVVWEAMSKYYECYALSSDIKFLMYYCYNEHATYKTIIKATPDSISMVLSDITKAGKKCQCYERKCLCGDTVVYF